jgi:transposase
MVRRHPPNLLTYLTHRLTNLGLEAVNSVIQWPKKTARECRNPEHLNAAIFVYCAGVDPKAHGSR